MGLTLSINEEKFSKDELDRHVTTLTTVLFENVRYEASDIIKGLVSDFESEGIEIPYVSLDLDRYEMYGKEVKVILSRLRLTQGQVKGEIIDDQLYEVEISN